MLLKPKLPLQKLFLLFWGFAASFAMADDAALQKLSERLGPLKSLRAQFVQTVTDDKGKVLQTSQGSLAVRRVNHLRWETTAPFAYLIVTDGSVLWRYDQDLEQVTRQPFKGELAATPALILGGDTSLIAANYQVSWEQGSTGDHFKLVPKKKNALFRELGLQFNGNTVSELTLRDNLEQRTDIRFSAVEPNAAQPDKLFQFEPPAGVDVIDEP